MLLLSQRSQVVSYAKELLTRGLVRGTGGNISVIHRESGLVAITPSGVDYQTMTPQDVTVIDLHGTVIDGDKKPSSEAGMHLSCYRSRDTIQAVVHTHSTYATVLACMGKSLPPIHYLIGYGGADTIPCIPYYTFGSQELADTVGQQFTQNNSLCGLLLGNHGLITVGNSLPFAFDAAEELEFVCELYYRTLLLGGGNLLNAQQMAIVNEKFKTYGQKQPPQVAE